MNSYFPYMKKLNGKELGKKEQKTFLTSYAIYFPQGSKLFDDPSSKTHYTMISSRHGGVEPGWEVHCSSFS